MLYPQMHAVQRYTVSKQLKTPLLLPTEFARLWGRGRGRWAIFVRGHLYKTAKPRLGLAPPTFLTLRGNFTAARSAWAARSGRCICSRRHLQATQAATEA